MNFGKGTVASPEEILAVVKEICIKSQKETLESVENAVQELREELLNCKSDFNTLGSLVRDTRSEEEKKNEHDEYRFKEYLSILLELHKAGHGCHDEINYTLARLQKLMFRKPTGG